MSMRHKIARLFVIKTRTEAWLVTYAVALGAVERGRHYLETYPGIGGMLLALACLAWCSWWAPSCSTRSGRYPLQSRRRRMRRQCSAVSRSVVFDPGCARVVPVQGHRFRFTEIYTRPHGIDAARKGALNIECAIGIGELHRSTGAGSRRRAQRLPGRGSKAPDR